MLENYLDVNPEIKSAISDGRPVVALESTIISHGMPYPKNVETALAVEQIVRDNGAVPATIAILDGRIKIGLTPDEIEVLGKSHDAVKASRRDIPFILAKGLTGATTVAATMILADLAGIRIFATGGIGGVHRGAQETFDISADLQELGKTNVAVICAGAKSILDIGLTLEYLETQGVPVVGYGTDELPAFYTSKSGYPVDYRLDTTEELAKALRTKWDLGLNGGVVIANPIPAEYEMDPVVINAAISAAVKEAEEKGIKGKESTPFLLAKVKELTDGASLDSNIQLVYNNAKIGAQIAVALSKLS
jgi:pseudouridine-5'-phosphate glycosidase